GLSGFGPRHAFYLMYQAMVILAYQDKLDKIKGHVNFKLHYTVFEKQGENTAGFGHAFQEDCDATVNTPVTKLPNFLGNVNSTEFQTLKEIADLPGTMYGSLKGRYTDLLEELIKTNPPAAVLFKNAFQHGEPNTSIACMTRGEWGKIQGRNIRKALDYIRDNMSDKIVIDILYSHEVIGVDFDTNPQKPGIKVKSGGVERTAQFDFVSFAHGTRLTLPLKPEVNPTAYYHATPNHKTMREYLTRRGILEDGRIRNNNKKIALTGLGLSFYDYASLLLAFLPDIEISTDPIKYIEHNAEKYQGLITVISHGKNGPAPPRTALDPNWRGGRSFFSARDMHALRLQRNSNWLPIAYEFLEAHIARTLRKLPSQVNSRVKGDGSQVTVREYMERYHKDILQYPNSAATETGLLRAGYTAFSIGTGIVSNIEDHERHLILEAPLSRSGRLGLPMFSSSCSEISSIANYDTDANTSFFKRWSEQLFFNYASPVPIQDIMSALFTSGIAVHVEGGFGDIGFSDDKFTFNDAKFDALLAPKTFDRKRDPALSAAVKNIIDGVPEYGKGGYFQTTEGEPIHAFDAGMGGSGAKVGKRTVGVQWSDGLTNNHAAAAEWASHHAFHTLALAVAMCHNPDITPIKTVRNILRRKHMSMGRQFNLEVLQFRHDWNDLQQRLFFLRLAADLAGDNANRYYEITDCIFSKETRDWFIAGLTDDERDKYDALKSKFVTSQYDPPTISQFESRFPDYTNRQYEEILEEIFQIA
ncbi:hypothetical protein K493DRAFT_179396, partial [Basidiobolus meristosporus CBS 931.73]